MPMRALLLFCLLAPMVAIAASPGDTVMLVSIDGFRPDYLDRGLTPSLNGLALSGVRAPMRPSFPSVTFPNHYTLVTGLTPDHHGIIHNSMLDETLPIAEHRRFTLSDSNANSDPIWWQQATPLWVTLHRQNRQSGILFWPGSEAEIFGVRPDFWLKWDEKVTYAARVDRVLAWLDLPKQVRPQFLALYLDHVDDAGHHFGIHSLSVDDAVAEADAAIERLSAGLQRRGLSNKVDLIIVSDHGMADVAPDHYLFIDDYAPAADYRIVFSGAVMGLIPNDGKEAELLTAKPHMTCRRRQDMPADLKIGANPRVPPVLCLAEIGWSITSHAEREKVAHPYFATHGYDPKDPDMAALFIAHGPAFRLHLVHPAFDNVDVYPLLAKLLAITPEPNDGHLEDIADMLRPNTVTPAQAGVQ
jgi:predicted AlkP superfamily pyrophosphatase or phosphodiesterase